jgi:hypothetical protein
LVVTPIALAVKASGGWGVPYLAEGVSGMPALDTRPRSQAERTFTSNVNVDGKGKIDVDFKNMLRGVVATAEAEGLFKQTEIRRQTQMQPAAQGPEE